MNWCAQRLFMQDLLPKFYLDKEIVKAVALFTLNLGPDSMSVTADRSLTKYKLPSFNPEPTAITPVFYTKDEKCESQTIP